MLGTAGEPGLCAHTLRELFQTIEDTNGDVEYEVSISYLEVWQGCPLTQRGQGTASSTWPHAKRLRAQRGLALDDMSGSFPLPRSTMRLSGTC